jgi:cytochrome c-type biogenesis protein CcmF
MFRGFYIFKLLQVLLAVYALAILGSFIFLTYNYIYCNFDLINVCTNSHTDQPNFFKICALWGNHEGSMLLWCLILSLYSCVLCCGLHRYHVPLNTLFVDSSHNSVVHRRVSSTQILLLGVVNLFFACFVVFTSNPFLIDELTPLVGKELNPILQDPVLSIHPPLIYLGYLGFFIPFIYSLTYPQILLGLKKVGDSWANLNHTFIVARFKKSVLFSWTLLTFGIALGSWWAYYELGWGGWWFWDPVENVSLLPWLLATALLHSIRKSYGIINHLAIGCFISGIVGTFFVRSGVLQSVHSFAFDTQKGLYLLLFVGFLIIGSSVLYSQQMNKYTASRQPSFFAGGLSNILKIVHLNPIIFVSIYVTILVATVFPVIWSYFFNSALSLGAPFFNHTIFPLVMCLLIFLIYTILRGYFVSSSLSLKNFSIFLVSVFMVFFIYRNVGESYRLEALSGITFNSLELSQMTFVFVSMILVVLLLGGVFVRRSTLELSMSFILGHLGVGLMVLSIAVSSSYEFEVIKFMIPGDQMRLGDLILTFRGVNHIEGSTYHSLYGNFIINGYNSSLDYVQSHLATLFPEKRFYLTNGVFTSKSAIYSSLFCDVSVLVGDGNLEGGWYVRASFKPLMVWLWLGALLFVGSGIAGFAKKDSVVVRLEQKYL